MAKLKSFIENYLKNKKISDYEGWLSLYGKDAESEYRKARAEADNAYAEQRAEHGTRAAALYEKGLSGSGYSDYLNHTAYAQRQTALALAESKKDGVEQENRKGYLAYLNSQAEEAEEAAKKAESEETKIFSDLVSQKLLNEDAAITYLTSRGIDPQKAEELAAQSIKVLRGSKSYLDQVISEASSTRMDYNTAYKLALAKGLDENAAQSAAIIASFIASQAAMNKYYY